jgi:hypothetical protein
MQRRARGNCSPEWLWLAAAHGGARVASEGLDPHSHLHPLFVGGGGVGLTGPVFCRYGPARIRGLLDGPFHPHPLSRRNNTRYQRFEGPARHALTCLAHGFRVIFFEFDTLVFNITRKGEKSVVCP